MKRGKKKREARWGWKEGGEGQMGGEGGRGGEKERERDREGEGVGGEICF